MRGTMVLLLVQLSNRSHRYVSRNVLTAQKLIILDTPVCRPKLFIVKKAVVVYLVPVSH